MKLCYLELHIWDFIVEYLQNGTVKMLDIECGGSPTCVEVKYTTHNQEILSKVIFTVVQIYEIVLSEVTHMGRLL